MVGDWHEVAIGELVEIFDGPHATPAKTVEGPVFLGISNLAQGRLHLSEIEHLSQEDYERWTRRVTPSAGDVVFSYETRLGEAALIPPNLRCCLGRRMGLLRAKPGRVDSRFLLYAYLGPQFQETIRARTVPGSTVDRIPLIDMAEFPIQIPTDIEEQRAIAHILGSLDDKIDLNRRMNETLEAMARALFKSWFVDFDPVRAKAEGRDPSLPKRIAPLFPDSFEGSDLGDIPVGWKVRSLSEVTTLITKGTTPTQNELGSAPASDSQVAYLRVNAIAEDGSILHDKLTRIPDTVHKDTLKRSILQTNDVAYTIAGTIGRIAVIEEGLLPANTNQAIAIIRLKAGIIPPSFLVQTMCQPAFQEELHSNIVHAVQANLSLGMLSRARAVFPPLELLEKMFRPIEDVLRKSSTNRGESRTLASLRDTLLPKLISGEHRIKDAERIAKAVR